VKVAGLTWRPYRLAFRQPFRTAHGTTTHREGLLLRLKTDDGVEGIGEVAPLPEFDGATLPDCLAAVEAVALGLVGLPLAGLTLSVEELAGRMVPAAVRCGLDVAALDAIGHRRGLPVAGLFVAEPRRDIVANATLGSLDTEATVAAARAAVGAGYGTLKLKVGVNLDPAVETNRIAAVRDAVGRAVKIRLDANAAWDVDQALRVLDELAPFDLEYVEQPVPADDLDGLARVRRGSSVPIAADEAVTGLEAARRVLAAGAADYLIVKPGIAGGVTVARAIDDLARAVGIGVIVTTALEAGPGLAAALHVAATLGPDAPACGLATAALLDSALVDGLPKPGPSMRLPVGPGLGVALREHLP
jgi:o-succinylbenzoate synthase